MWAFFSAFVAFCMADVGSAFLTDRRSHHSYYTLGAPTFQIKTRLPASSEDEANQEAGRPIAVTIDTTLSDEKMKALYAWIKCAFSQDPYDQNDVYAYYYSNIELAIAAAFGNNLPKDSLPAKLMEMALKSEGDVSSIEWENLLVGDEISRRERESASMGAMGAAQWSGRFMTRPHCKYIDQRRHSNNLSLPSNYFLFVYQQRCWISGILRQLMIGSRLFQEVANERFVKPHPNYKILQLSTNL